MLLPPPPPSSRCPLHYRPAATAAVLPPPPRYRRRAIAANAAAALSQPPCCRAARHRRPAAALVSPPPSACCRCHRQHPQPRRHQSTPSPSPSPLPSPSPSPSPSPTPSPSPSHLSERVCGEVGVDGVDGAPADRVAGPPALSPAKLASNFARSAARLAANPRPDSLLYCFSVTAEPPASGGRPDLDMALDIIFRRTYCVSKTSDDKPQLEIPTHVTQKNSQEIKKSLFAVRTEKKRKQEKEIN